MRQYVELGQMIGRLGMLVVLMIVGGYWLIHCQFELALLCGILLSLIDIEGKLDRLRAE